MKGEWIDLSYPVEPRMPVQSNYPPVEITILDSTERQGPGGPRRINNSRLAIGLHTGTHMDAPFHFLGDGVTCDRIPLEQCMGPTPLARLPEVGPRSSITLKDLEPYREAVRETGKIVISTGWNRWWGDPSFFTDHPEIALEAAERLIEWGARLVGVDFPSVDRPPFATHIALLGSGAVIVENLARLDAIGTARFRLVALPLKLVGRDGSPVRAIGEEI